MGLEYRHLDDRTRKAMLAEVQQDIQAGRLYLSENLSPQGKQDYPQILREAVETGSDDSLAAALRTRLNSHEKPRALKSGGYSKPPVMRVNAHEMLAEGEFNRFYLRGLCQRAIEDGVADLVVFRAKFVQSPRSASEQMIGSRVKASDLLRDLRSSPGVDTALGLPPGPNSGLSAHLS